MLKLLGSLCLLSSALVAQAAVTQDDFTGIGNMFVLNSSDWNTATLDQQVGCLDDYGRFISDEDPDGCGVFSRLNEYPWTLSSKFGNCSFNDESTETNTDSKYGGNDHAWSCTTPYNASIYDELYTIDGFPYTFLCFGDIACYYDAKRVPAQGEKLSVWKYRWGSQQMGITPGHVQLLLVWNKTGDLPKRADGQKIPSPRIELRDGLQVPLQGERTRA